MRRLAAIALVVLAVPGCGIGRTWSGPVRPVLVPYCDNPVFVPAANREQFWETLVDVVDDYFEIEREQPIQAMGTALTEGRIDTQPLLGATVFEPWHRDSVGAYERWESTLQSMRRRAEIRVVPGQGGYWVYVAVFKELEDTSEPFPSTAGAATFRNDNSLTRVVNPIGEQETNEGWIPRGRDMALEQRILGDLQARFGVPPPAVVSPSPAPGAIPLPGPCPPPCTPCTPTN